MTHPPQVDIWRARHAEVAAERIARFRSWMSEEESERAARYRRPQDQLRYVVGRGMLRELLERYTGTPAASWQFQLGKYGRPEPRCTVSPESAAPHFNLSHSRGVTVAAFAWGVEMLGADIEAHDRATHVNLAHRYFAPSEAATVEDADEVERGDLFLRYWTLKEAYVKAVGQGISLGLDTFAFQLSEQSPPTVSFVRESSGPPEAWHFFELPNETERVAVAVRSGPRPPVEVKDF